MASVEGVRSLTEFEDLLSIIWEFIIVALQVVQRLVQHQTPVLGDHQQTISRKRHNNKRLFPKEPSQEYCIFCPLNALFGHAK
jgi:hypothetical protein